MHRNSKRHYGGPYSSVGTALLSAGMAIGLTASAAEAAAPFNDPSDVAAITKIETELAIATAMKDVIGYYAPDAIVLDIGAPGIYKGREQIQAEFDQQLAALKSLRATLLDTNIASDGKFACAAVRIKADVTMKDGSALTVTSRQLDGYKKIDGKWQILEQHISVPADPKTGMAVMDGEYPARGPIKWSDALVPGPASSAAQAKTDIRQWIETGARSTSIEQMMAYYGPGDDTLVYNELSPGELRGLKEIRDNYAPMMNRFTEVKSFNMPLFVSDSDGAFGIQIDTQDMQLAMKDGSLKIVSLRQSDCLRRADGKWKSFFEMISFPVEMKSGKAIMEDQTAFK